ncbi:hypothetical protein AcW2_006201 [Taiwanofungus camphoratus]|nr:hypothetical protein AcW2_006201 [Antrodia cinnamomea]
MVKQKKLRKASQDPEANPSRDTLFPKTKAHEIRGTQRDIDDSAYVFIVNICFAFAGFANFFSLLDFGNQSVNVGCTFVVAWGSMASFSARLASLLMLSSKLRQLSIRNWETYSLWAGLVIVLALVFALNATSTGTTSYLPVALASSLTLIALELYTAIRLLAITLFHSSRLRKVGTSAAKIDIIRAVSLLTLDLLTIVPTAIRLNILAEFIPFSVGALFVIAAFNYSGCTHLHTEHGRSLGHRRNISYVSNTQRMSYLTANSFTPRPFLLHIADSQAPLGPWNSATAEQVDEGLERRDEGNQRTLVLDIHESEGEDSRHSYRGELIPPLPQSAPARLDNASHTPKSRPRQILPFQVQFAEQFEQREAVQDGLAVRRPRERPQIFVMIQDEDPPKQFQVPGSAVFGSDIIRLTPRKQKRGSAIWSPDSTAQTSYLSPSTHDSYPHSALRDSIMSTYSAYTHMQGSSSDDASHLQHRSDLLSPRDSIRVPSWRKTPRHSLLSIRTQGRDELPTVAEGSTDGGEGMSITLPVGRSIRSKRRTFGRQPMRYVKQDNVYQSKSSESLTPITIPSPSHFRSTFSHRNSRLRTPASAVPMLSPLPWQSAADSVSTPRRSYETPHSVARIRGPRPLPTAATPTSATTRRTCDETSHRGEGTQRWRNTCSGIPPDQDWQSV